MLYLLGALSLDVRPFNVEDVSRQATASIASKALFGAFPAKEFTGEGDDKLTLSGKILPFHLGGLSELEIAHEMRRAGTRFPVMRGDGVALGWHAFTSITEGHKELAGNGVGYVISHKLSLVKVTPDIGSGQQVIHGLLKLFEVMGR